MDLRTIRELVGHAIDNGIASNRRQALEYLASLRWCEDRYWDAWDEMGQPDPDRDYDDHGGRRGFAYQEY